MADKIKVVPDLMKEMSQSLDSMSQLLEEFAGEWQNIAENLEGGALLGQGGSALTDGIRNTLNPVGKRLQEKLVELAGDVQQAMGDITDQDQISARMF